MARSILENCSAALNQRPRPSDREIKVNASACVKAISPRRADVGAERHQQINAKATQSQASSIGERAHRQQLPDQSERPAPSPSRIASSFFVRCPHQAGSQRWRTDSKTSPRSEEDSTLFLRCRTAHATRLSSRITLFGGETVARSAGDGVHLGRASTWSPGLSADSGENVHCVKPHADESGKGQSSPG